MAYQDPIPTNSLYIWCRPVLHHNVTLLETVSGKYICKIQTSTCTQYANGVQLRQEMVRTVSQKNKQAFRKLLPVLVKEYKSSINKRIEKIKRGNYG